MWVQLIELGIIAGDFIYHRWFEDKPKPPQPPTPNAPRTDEGAPIPIIYGRCRIRQPILIWTGSNTVSGPDGGPYTFTLSMLFVLGIPFGFEDGKVRLKGIWVGDQLLGFLNFGAEVTGDGGIPGVGGVGELIADSGLIRGMQGPNLVGGRVEFLNGKSTQQLVDPTTPFTATTATGAVLSLIDDPSTIPGYRGRALAFLYGDIRGVGWSIGGQPHPNTYNFEVLAHPNFSLTSDEGPGPVMGGDAIDEANPADVLYDLLVSTYGKLGLSIDSIDIPSFAACAFTLIDEGNGYSRSIETAQDALQIINEILAQIDGVIYEDPVSGTIKLRLVRADYDIDAVPNINPDNCEKLDGYAAGSWVNLPNRVRVVFTDRASSYNDGSRSAHNMANAFIGRSIEAEVQFPGCCIPSLASKLAARELAARSIPISKCSPIVDESFWQVVPGDVVTITWPQYNLDKVAFRVANVDRGQLHDGKIRLDLMTDVFGQALGGFVLTTPPPFVPLLLPITERKVTEAPLWMVIQQVDAGTTTDAAKPHILAMAVKELDDTAGFREDDRRRSLYPQPFIADMFGDAVQLCAKVQTAYPRTADPYDTTIGLVVDTITGGTGTDLGIPFLADDDAAGPIQDARQAAIAETGLNLILVGDELIAYEWPELIGVGQCKLHRVWRGLLDTAVVDHPVGERVYWLYPANVGHRVWGSISTLLNCMPRPFIGWQVGSGEDPIDNLGLQSRWAKEYPVADLNVNGMDVIGDVGLNSIGGLKRVSLVEEGIDVLGVERDRLNGTITRGDAPAEIAASPPRLFAARAQKIGGAQVPLSTGAATPAWTALGLGAAGHGEIDVQVTTDVSGAPKLWQTPAVRATAPRWRNLLVNSRFDYGDLRGWTQTAGTMSVAADATSLSLATDGTYAAPATHDGGDYTTFHQDVDVSGYLPRKMNAIADLYILGGVDSAEDDCLLSIDALDSGGSSLLTQTSSPVSLDNANWLYMSASMADVPAGTVKLRVTVQLHGAPLSTAKVTELSLRLGQWTDNLLVNPTFDDSFTGWTDVSNSFVIGTALPYATLANSPNYAQGGNFNGSEIKQEVAIPDGHQHGTVALTCARASTTTYQGGVVVVEILDGGGGVIATGNVEDFIPSLLLGGPPGSGIAGVNASPEGYTAVMVSENVWYRRRVAVDLPADGTAVTIRVRLIDNSAMAQSGALFDDLRLMIHQDLDPTYELALDFSTPAPQRTPATWQEFHLAFPKLQVPIHRDPATNFVQSTVFGGTDDFFAIPGGLPDTFAWSDAPTVHPPAKLVGAFGGAYDDIIGIQRSINAYRFTRAGADILNVGNVDDFGAYKSADAFTVIVLFAVDEPGFASVCGLVGRRGPSLGWGLKLDATGHVEAVLGGSSGSKTATKSGTTCIDGALHMAAIVYDPTAHTLRAYDERGHVEVSTASGLGEIALSGKALRLGKSVSTDDCIPGMIARCYVFDGHALSAAEIASIWKYGQDPTGKITTLHLDQSVWADGQADNDGATLKRIATDQCPLMHDSRLTSGARCGFAATYGHTNLASSFDFTDATHWSPEATVTLTQSIVDPTGLPRGVHVAGDATHGIKMLLATVGANANLRSAVWARAVGGSGTLSIELLDASDVVKDSTTFELTAGWQKFSWSTAMWDAATATCRLRFRCAAAFDLGHVSWLGQGVAGHLPASSLYPDAGVALSDVYAEVATAIPAQFNAQGELDVTGVATLAAPDAALTIARVDNNADDKNRRDLFVDTAAVAALDHYDGAGVDVVSDSSSTPPWDVQWRLRGRWSRCKTLDDAANAYAGIVVGSASAGDYGRSATWTNDLTPAARVLVGGAAPMDAVIATVAVRARESKLP